MSIRTDQMNLLSLFYSDTTKNYQIWSGKSLVTICFF